MLAAAMKPNPATTCMVVERAPPRRPVTDNFDPASSRQVAAAEPDAIRGSEAAGPCADVPATEAGRINLREPPKSGRSAVSGTPSRNAQPTTGRDLSPVNNHRWAGPVSSATCNPEPTAGRGHVLLVADDALMREIFADGLQSGGYRVGCAKDDEAGCAALGANRFDLLLTDHDLRGLSGLDLLRSVRVRLLDLPAILISGNMPWDETDLLELLSPGA
jgi:CheY-like chemotaxis protein